MKKKTSPKPAINDAAARLRAVVLASKEGVLIGSEDAIVAMLGFSRNTVRQVARLLEREGLLRVKRGINGGYFGARPNVQTIENAVSSYLETLQMEVEDVTVVASALWVEVLRKAASLRSQAATTMAETFRIRVKALKQTVGFDEILDLERENRAAIFELTNCRYIELIFTINAAFANRRFSARAVPDDSDVHRDFVRAWRDAKLLELNAISEGDPELGVMAARHIRHIWHKRVWGHPEPE
jgi:DNA-binding GntR family transcriptional regulator